MKADDPRTGLTPADIAYMKFVNHPKSLADVPTSQEVADRTVHLDSEFEPDTEDADTSEIDTDNDIPVTEEQRLKRLLASFMRSIWEYFCAAQ